MHEAPKTRPLFFYTTAPLPCPYIDGRMERKVVVELAGREATRLHDELSRAGFRRSHGIAYTPACTGCNACIPLRVDVDAFDHRVSRSFRRVWNANADVTARRVRPTATAEQYRLFARYQDGRHADGDMYPPSRDQFSTFLVRVHKFLLVHCFGCLLNHICKKGVMSVRRAG